MLHSHYVGGSKLKVRRVSQTHEAEDPFQALGRLLNLFESQFSHWQKEKFVHVKVLAFCLLHDGHSVNVSLLFLFNLCQNTLVETWFWKSSLTTHFFPYPTIALLPLGLLVGVSQLYYKIVTEWDAAREGSVEGRPQERLLVSSEK